MKCRLKDRKTKVEGYLFGHLSKEERVDFEEHFFDCEECEKDLSMMLDIKMSLNLNKKSFAPTIPKSNKKNIEDESLHVITPIPTNRRIKVKLKVQSKRKNADEMVKDKKKTKKK